MPDLHLRIIRVLRVAPPFIAGIGVGKGEIGESYIRVDAEGSTTSARHWRISLRTRVIAKRLIANARWGDHSSSRRRGGYSTKSKYTQGEQQQCEQGPTHAISICLERESNYPRNIWVSKITVLHCCSHVDGKRRHTSGSVWYRCTNST